MWKVWTDPNHVHNWWGPAGFSTTTHSMEVKPGGMWRYVMHGPDGRDYQNLIVYQEVQEPQRLVYKHGGGEDTEPVNFQTVVTFDKAGPSGEQTQVTMRSVFPSQEARDFVIREYHAVEGAGSTLADCPKTCACWRARRRRQLRRTTVRDYSSGGCSASWRGASGPSVST